MSSRRSRASPPVLDVASAMDEKTELEMAASAMDEQAEQACLDEQLQVPQRQHRQRRPHGSVVASRPR